MSSNRSDYRNEIPQGSETPLPRHVSRAVSSNINVAFPAAFINKAALLEAGVDVEQLLSVKTDIPMKDDELTGEDEAQYQKLLEEAQKVHVAKPLTTEDTAISLLRMFYSILKGDFSDLEGAFLDAETEGEASSEDKEENTTTDPMTKATQMAALLEDLHVQVGEFLEEIDLEAQMEAPDRDTTKTLPMALLSALYEPAPEAEVAQQQSRKERENFQARSKILETLPRRKGWTRYIWPDQGIPVEGGLDPDGSSDKGMGWFQRSKDRLYRMSITTGAWDVSVLNEETLIYHIVLKGTWNQETPEDFPK